MIDKTLLTQIKDRADSPDWKEKERAANQIKDINDEQFLEYFPVWAEWVKHPNPNVRRAVEVGLLRIKREYSAPGLDLLGSLVYDPDVYVRKNCGPFALAAIGFRSPELTFRKLYEWMKTTDKYVLWNIAMSLGVRFGQSHPVEALKLLKDLAKNPDKFVRRAAASSLIKLLRRYANLRDAVMTWKDCEDCLNTVRKYIK